MFSSYNAQVEVEAEIIKEPNGTEQYSCDELRIRELIQTRWKGSYILVTGLPGIGKTSLLEKLADKLNDSQELRVYKFENIKELQKTERHFENTHDSHELIILVDNVTSCQVEDLIITNRPNVTIVIFSRTLLVDKFDCVVRIEGSCRHKRPSWDNHSAWNSHIDVLCSIPFLLVLFETLYSNRVSCHDIYVLLLSSYISYCQTLQVSLFTCLEEVPGRVEKCLRNIADVAYSCVSKDCTFVDDNELRRYCDVSNEMGVITRTDDGRWKFTFEGSANCLAAIKLFWDSEEEFVKDTGTIKIPHETMKLFKGVVFLHN